jgi:hypothetical protein
MDLVFHSLCKPGDTVLAEGLTFSGMKALAQHRGYKLAGVSMDEEGIIPEALVEAVKTSGARVLYVMPTLQNPTGRCLGAARRRELIKTARRLDICFYVMVPVVEGSREYGLRFCIGAPRRDVDFERGLGIVKRVLAQRVDYALQAVV